MKKYLLNFCMVVGLSVIYHSANANLIINGGFERPEVRHDCWRWFLADDVYGWSGSNIEVWDNLNGFSSFEGSNILS